MMIGEIWLTPPMIRDLSKSVGVHRTTVARWIKIAEIPPPIRKLLDLTENGNISHIHSTWDGWKIDPKNGDLMRPDRRRGHPMAVSAGEIMSTQYRIQQITALEQDKGKLHDQCEGQEKIINGLRALVSEQNGRIDRLETQLATASSHKIVHLRDRSA